MENNKYTQMLCLYESSMLKWHSGQRGYLSTHRSNTGHESVQALLTCPLMERTHTHTHTPRPIPFPSSKPQEQLTVGIPRRRHFDHFFQAPLVRYQPTPLSLGQRENPFSDSLQSHDEGKGNRDREGKHLFEKVSGTWEPLLRRKPERPLGCKMRPQGWLQEERR